MASSIEGLQPSSPRPLYQQVKDRIRTRVRGGDWAPGRRIPSENQLVRELGVSRMTVHRALRELAAEGVLLRIAGVGTFVAEPAHHASLIELRAIAEEIREQGGAHRARLVRKGREMIDPAIAERLGKPIASEAFRVTLVHLHDGRPIQLEDRWVDPARAPAFLEVDFETTTPSEHLLETIVPEELEHVVQAVMPDPMTCELLAIAPDEPCLRLRRRTWNGGAVVTYAELTYPSSRYDLASRYAVPEPGSPPRPPSPPTQSPTRNPR